MEDNRNDNIVVGRFAPSPSGRLHLGNVFTALMSWLSVRSRGGKWILRIEDLDPQRSKIDYARQIEDDLNWLGLDWDEGGVNGKGGNGPYLQSQRDVLYLDALNRLNDLRLTYRCHCTRADIMATQAPHESDGRVVYHGTCRPQAAPPFQIHNGDQGATRLYVPEEDFVFADRVFGEQSVNLTRHCGDFVVRRADGAWAYQLAVVVDDGLMGVTEVVRGCDLMLSTAQQLYLYRLLGYKAPQFAHLPLVCNAAGQRLSKRDQSMSMAELRQQYAPEEVIGKIASMARIIEDYEPRTAESLVGIFDWGKVPPGESIIV